MAQLVNPLKIHFCSRFIFEILPSDFSLIDDSLFSNIFDSHFDIQTADYYNKVLPALKTKESIFNRTLIEIYSSEFLDTRKKNPSLTDPENSGTTENHAQITKKR